jgi:hypothetical protein
MRKNKKRSEMKICSTSWSFYGFWIFYCQEFVNFLFFYFFFNAVEVMINSRVMRLFVFWAPEVLNYWLLFPDYLFKISSQNFFFFRLKHLLENPIFRTNIPTENDEISTRYFGYMTKEHYLINKNLSDSD